ncbi:MAG: hypothetical protein BMS9Abin07_1382 [Acidimicrobiia bacterium]|nr:MAG: hypothetical protein BMS9Abin07_1382 [Acidimicrobiia bacterium]
MEWADLDRITKALARVQGELIDLADDDFAGRHELLQRRDQLRRDAAAFRVDFDAQRPTQDMLDELSGLRHHLSELEGRRIDMVKQSGGSAAGPGAEGWGGVSLNQQIDAAGGMAEIKARIGRIKGILIDRGVEIPEAL